MPRTPTLLAVHPHPDDESIACGGVLAATAAHPRRRAVVVTCTGGEEGDNLAGIDLGDEPLAVHRRRELAAALDALGVGAHHLLGYRDSGMAGTPANDHPDSFHRAELGAAAARLAAIIRAERPDVVVSDDEHGTYGHPDHVKAHRVTVRAVELAADPDADLPGRPWRVAKRYVHTIGRGRLLDGHRALRAAGLPSPFGDADPAGPDEVPFGTSDELVTTRVDVSPWLAAKRAALAAHASQIGPDSFFLNTPDELVDAVFGCEEFVLEHGPPVDGEEQDLFAGLVGADDAGAVLDPRDAGEFRAVLGRFASGVSVMATRHAGRAHGMTASALASLSLDPPLVLVAVSRTAVMADEVAAGGVFSLSFLGADQAERSARFADPGRPLGDEEFAGLPVVTAATGAPVLADAHGWVDCVVRHLHDGGDHVIVVGEVLALGPGSASSPLLYHRGRYGQLAEDT